MSIITLEDAIVAKLKADVTDVKVEAFPDDPRSYKLTHVKGAMLVRYDGSKFSKGKALSSVNQFGVISFRIDIVSKGLRTHQGIYPLLQKGRDSLTGFQVQGYSQMRLSDEKFLDQREGLWYYYQVFSMNGRNCEVNP